VVASDPVTEQIGTDLEADLVDAGLDEAQARAMRRAVERAVDRILASFATRNELFSVRDELRAEMRSIRDDLRSEIAGSERRISVQLRIMWAVLALVGSGLFAMMAAILTKL
jgi:hypothetical protein